MNTKPEANTLKPKPRPAWAPCPRCGSASCYTPEVAPDGRLIRRCINRDCQKTFPVGKAAPKNAPR
ncbi:MAG: hypothetical protein H3C30_05310 [Candidatus Hydrogenedentes bacterium]|nr:hypothetical protein [Candidatus Hydrogenedentota bacterium]